MAILTAVLLALQGDDWDKLLLRAQKLDKISTIEAVAAEAKEISDIAQAYLQKTPDGDKALQAYELLSTVNQEMGRRYMIANELARADEYYVQAVRASRTLVDKVAAQIAAAKEDPDRVLEQRSLFAGYQYVVAIHHRAYAIRADPARRDELEKQVGELEVFFKEYFNNHDTYFLAVDAATYLGCCYQFVAETYGSRFSVADRYWTQCFSWLAKGRDLMNLRDMRDQEDAHDVAARSVLHEIQARLAYSRQLKAAAGPWDRQLQKAVDSGVNLLQLLPSLRRKALGQKIQSEIQAAEKALRE